MDDPQGIERRLLDRKEVSVLLNCRVPARPSRATMHDLSHEGCRIEVPEANIELGATALLDLPGAPAFPGRVMWVKGHQAGIRFMRRIGQGTAVALGIEEPEPDIDPEPEAPKHEGEGLLRHWVRKLMGFSR